MRRISSTRRRAKAGSRYSSRYFIRHPCPAASSSAPISSNRRQRALGFFGIHAADGEPHVHDDVIAAPRFRHEIETGLPGDAAEPDRAHAKTASLLRFNDLSRNRQTHTAFSAEPDLFDAPSRTPGRFPHQRSR